MKGGRGGGREGPGGREGGRVERGRVGGREMKREWGKGGGGQGEQGG